ncbi:MAG: PulJ/GspJ family protein [Acidimicrobiales bacterium]
MLAAHHARRFRTAPGTSARRFGDESGFSLTELIVASLILSIILGITLVISTSVFQQATLQAASGQSASTAQSAVDTMSLYLRGAVSPANWATSNDDSTTVKGCWNSSTVTDPTSTGLTAPTPVSYSPPVTSVAGSPGHTGGGALFRGTTGKYTIPAPANTAIIVAHDFDVVFCGYKPEASATATAHVYRLWIDPSTCKPAPGPAPGGGLTDDICTLVLEDLGTSATCSTWTPAGPTEGSISGGTCTAPVGKRVLAHSVWCSVTCQEDIKGTLPAGSVVTTPALFTYYTSGSAGTALRAPMDDTSVAGGNSLVDIHDVSMNISVITDAVSHASTGSGRVVSKATGNLYLAGTATSS